MDNSFIYIISFLYAASGIVSTIGYFPTIKDLFNGKKSANVSSYVIWTVTGFFPFIYAIFIIKDLLLEIVTGLGFFSCLIILILALNKKYK
ncbi:MAG: hypothetical protein AABX26_03725 [Nanoarchaeota archaeon]